MTLLYAVILLEIIKVYKYSSYVKVPNMTLINIYKKEYSFSSISKQKITVRDRLLPFKNFRLNIKNEQVNIFWQGNQ